MHSNKPITESVEIYPAGRGHILAIVKKKIPPKTRKYKHPQPRFTHTRIKANPQDITITEYLAEDQRKHIYQFPEKIELNANQREDLALSLLCTLPRYLGKGTTMKFPVFLTHEQRTILKQKWRRYKKWRKKH